MNTSYKITSEDRFHLSFGALFGYCFVQYMSGSVLLSLIVGVPMGIGGMAVAILALRFLGLEGNAQQQRGNTSEQFSRNSHLYNTCVAVRICASVLIAE